MKKRKYAIVDIETTGGMYQRDKITEIAIIVTDGHQIISKYQTLIYPERSIPYHITNITGINDTMVADAPKFYEVAKKIINILDGCVFVAHNVQFDYNFIKEEFKSLGYAFNKKKLCTVKLCRSTIPGLNSYSLGNLIQHFDIKVDHRHRAYDDTLATYKIFRYILSEMDSQSQIEKLINQGLDATVLPKGMNVEDIHDLPETTGVYYLSNAHNRVLYVGKAKNIKKRVFEHFRKISIKSNQIYQYVDRVHYEESGNELAALLIELYEIKRLNPELNKAMKRRNYNYAIYHNTTAKTNQNTLVIGRNNKSNDFKYQKLKLFSTKSSADSFAQRHIEEHDMCSKLFKSRSIIFDSHCSDYCGHTDLQQSGQIEEFIKLVKNNFKKNFIILLAGRNKDEFSFTLICDKRFYGLGYISSEEVVTSINEWKEHILYKFWCPEAHNIIKTYTSTHSCEIVEL